MKMPTEAELDAVPVDDADVAEWEGYRKQVAKAFEKARIPRTLDWAFIVLRFAAQSACTQGMPADYFQMIAEACFQDGRRANGARPRTKPSFPIDPSVKMDTWPARVNRILGALQTLKLNPTGPEVLYGLICLPAELCVDCAMPLEAWMFIVGDTWKDSEQAIIAGGRKNQA